jgi:hypothetical protein
VRLKFERSPNERAYHRRKFKMKEVNVVGAEAMPEADGQAAGGLKLLARGWRLYAAHLGTYPDGDATALFLLW